MDYYFSRIQDDLQWSRRFAEQNELEIRRSRRVQEAIQVEEDLRRFATAQKLRADRQYEEYLLRRQAQQRQVEVQYAKEKVIRQQFLAEQAKLLEVERLSRVIRQQEAQRQRIILQAEERKRAEYLQASRRAELQVQKKVQDEVTRQNLRVRQEQLQQQKLEAELKAIDLQIGTIYDKREARRKTELLELEGLDEKIFKVKQEMRSSKIKQAALQDSLNNLSKIIVPGSK